MVTSGEERASELDVLATSVRNADFLSVQLLVRNAPAHIQNVMSLVTATEEITRLAEVARDLTKAFAQTVEREGAFGYAKTEEVRESLRARSLEAIGKLKQAVVNAEPSEKAVCLGLG